MNLFEQNVMKRIFSWRTTHGFSMTDTDFHSEFLTTWEEPDDFSETFSKVLSEVLTDKEKCVIKAHYKDPHVFTRKNIQCIFPEDTPEHIRAIDRGSIIKLSKDKNWDRLYKGDTVLSEWEKGISRIKKYNHYDAPAAFAELNLSKRATRVLKQSKCRTIEDVMKYENFNNLQTYNRCVAIEVTSCIKRAGYNTERMEHLLASTGN